jgi:hypothetical protein
VGRREAESTTKPFLRPVIEHWNGRRWQLMANPPVPSMTALTSVRSHRTASKACTGT